MLETINSPINLNLIRDYHSAITYKVSNIPTKPGHFRSKKEGVGFQLAYDWHRYTAEGMIDLINKIAAGKDEKTIGRLTGATLTLKAIKMIEDVPPEFEECYSVFLYQFDSKLSSDSLGYLKESYPEQYDKFIDYLSQIIVNEKTGADYTSDSILSLTQEAIDFYKNAISKPTSDDEKLEIIGKTIQWLERIHPFNDANGRTFANLLLTRMLLENGFPPATFMDPNIFDTFHDLINGIKRSIENTQHLYAT